MNCKPGDLAVIVRSEQTHHEVGRIVEVIEFVGPNVDYTGPDGQWWGCGESGWLTRYITSENLVVLDVWVDRCLRPIRDNPGEDETLQWAPVPGVKELANTEKAGKNNHN